MVAIFIRVKSRLGISVRLVMSQTMLSYWHLTNSFFQALLARERARAEFQDWEKKEEEVLCFEFPYICSCLVVVLPFC